MEDFYNFFKNLQPLSERASLKLSFDTIFITVGEKLVDEIDFENFIDICSFCLLHLYINIQR